jgi:hypothetical protein
VSDHAEALAVALELTLTLDTMQSGRWPYSGEQHATLDPATVDRARREALAAYRKEHPASPADGQRDRMT